MSRTNSLFSGPVSRALLSTALTVPLGWSASAAIHFVNVNAFGVKNGNSWATAYSSIQDALTEAVNGDEIWVAKGTYKPTTTTDRAISFNMKTGVTIRGGFVVGDDQVTDADPVVNETILSGEIGSPGIADNSLHVVKASSVASWKLDGFIIQGGNASLGGNPNGGGMLVSLANNWAIQRCVFKSNTSTNGGGALLITGSSGVFSNCDFLGNTAGGAGGAINYQQGVGHFVNCRFIGNSLPANASGGAIHILSSGTVGNPAKFHGCLFASNSTFASGGAISLAFSSAEILGCTIVDNSAIGDTGGISASDSTLTLSNSIMRGNVGTGPGLELQQVSVTGSTVTDSFNCIEGLDNVAPFNGVGSVDLDPLFFDPDGPNNIPGDLDDDYSLRTLSPCIDSGDGSKTCKDLGDADGDGIVIEALQLDINGNIRLYNDVRPDTGAPAFTFVDMGAYEFNRDYIIYFVDKDAPGGDGTTWANAFNNLQAALFLAGDVRSGGPGEIWVAEGTYLTTTTTDQTKSFVLPNGARLFGGFAGNEVSRSQRDFIAHPTILSGEINTSGVKDNAHHVLTATGSFIDECLVDGFVITGGFADDATGQLGGGGIKIDQQASVSIRNCRFIDNHATTGEGGGAAAVLGNAFFANCTFTGNSATDFGGALFQSAGSFVILSNCTLAGNSSKFGAGGVTVNGSTCQAQNTILFDNTSTALTGQNAQFSVSAGAFSPFNCCIQCLQPGSPVLLNFANPPKFVDAKGPDGIYGTMDDDLRLQPFSPCIDKGKPGLFVADTFDADDDGITGEFMSFDANLSPRFVDDTGIVDGIANPDHIDVGACEFQGNSSGPLPVFADINGDGIVDGADLGLLLAAFGTGDSSADLDFSCTVDGADLGLLLSNWTT